MSKVVFSLLDDGSHLHMRNGIGMPCRKNHKKVDWRTPLIVGGFFLFFTLAVHLILKSKGL